MTVDGQERVGSKRAGTDEPLGRSGSAVEAHLTPEAERAQGHAARALANAEGYRSHTVQWMPDPDRYEVIYCRAPRCGLPGAQCGQVDRCGDLEAVILVAPDGALTLERR